MRNGLWLILPPAPGLAARSRCPGPGAPQQQPSLAPRRTVQGWATAVERHRIVDLKPHRPVPRGSTTTTTAASDPARHANRQDKPHRESGLDVGGSLHHV